MHSKSVDKIVKNESGGTWPLHGHTREANFIKSTLYKWLQLWELPFSVEKSKFQMDLLAENIKILSPLGLVTGKNDFINIFGKAGDFIADFVLSDINIYPCGVGTYTAQAVCQYKRTFSDGTSENFVLQIEADLMKINPLKFIFQRIIIKKTEEAFRQTINTYERNRASEVIYYCMGIIEHNISDPKFYRDCFAKEFTIYPLQSAIIKNENDLNNWITGINGKLKGISIDPVNLQIVELPGHEIEVKFDLLFIGKNHEGQTVNSLSKNCWTLENDSHEAFARIKSIHVEKLEPIFI